MPARLFAYDKDTGELERTGQRTKWNWHKDYLKTKATLGNKRTNEYHLKEAKRKLALYKNKKKQQ